MPKIPRTPRSNEQDTARQVAIIEIEGTELLLVEMITREDDEEYFTFQNNNRDHLAVYGNAIDPTVEAVGYRRKQNQGARFGIRLHDTLIGVVGHKPILNSQETEIYIAVDRDKVGNGYASSAVEAFTAFIKQDYERIIANILPVNMKSIRLFERAGYKRQDGLADYSWGSAVQFVIEAGGINARKAHK